MNDLNDRLSENLSQKFFFGSADDLTVRETEGLKDMRGGGGA